jgi:hypothetical protein
MKSAGLIKTATAIAGLLILSVSAYTQQQNHPITRQGRPLYAIILDKDADSLTCFAANELQDYLFRISGAQVRISDKPLKRFKSIFIGRDWFSKKEASEKLDALNGDGFCIFSESGHFFLGGKRPVGDLYAMYTLLEEYAGCIWFGNGEVHIPQRQEFTLPDISLYSQPDFRFRHPHFPGNTEPGNYIPARTQPRDEWGMFVHTFHKLMPPDTYFGKHPEYYSQVNGKRIRDGQLCLSNPEVIRILTENLGAEMMKKPQCTYWSVSQNDCINYCECSQCQDMYDRYGSISGAYVHMANQIARNFPDKQISTLAYQFTRSAPSATVPDSNVNIMFCSIECNRSQPLATDPRSADFVVDMKDWSALTGNIFMWDYVVQFKTFTCPFPNFGVLQPNIRFFREHGVPMMFQQGSGNAWSDFSEYKQSLISRLLWDADLNESAFREKFFYAFYGAAADIMLNYFSLVHLEMEKQSDSRVLDIYGYPALYSDWFLKPELLIRYRAMMDSAEAMVRGDSVRLKRVIRQRCSLDLAFIDIALNVNNPEFSFYRIQDGRRIVNPEMIDYLGRFVRNCEASGIRTLDENAYSPQAYKAHALNVAAMAVKPNKAAGKQITSLTPYTPLYDAGGTGALTDGLFGGQHFRLNWLGYQGHNMEVLIDFGQKETVRKAEVNFFLDLVSWIFLPLEVKIEASDDGTVFRTLHSEKIPETERRFGQKPVHFMFSFAETATRYLKFTAIGHKTCPDWHRGANQPAWLFIDELVIE